MDPSHALPLEPLPYHQGVVRALRDHQAELWAWFSAEKIRAERDESVRLDLLRSTYRLERDAHPALHAAASEAAARLSFDGGTGLDEPIALYQAQGGLGLNASLAYVPGEVHLVLHGPVGERLAPLELRAVLGHELTHFLLLDRWREYHVASQILAALTQGEAADAAHRSTARRFNLYAEVYCDRGAYLASGDVAAVVAALVKIETGAAEASAESFLRQADEIFERGKDAARAGGVTHPEAFIRARAVKLWAEAPERTGGPPSGPGGTQPPGRGGTQSPGPGETELERAIEGPLSLAELDLLGQEKVTALTRRLLAAFLRPDSLRSGALLAHARLFFEDYFPEGWAPSAAGDPRLADDLRGGDAKLLDYWCYVLLDLAAVDRDKGGAPLAAAFALAGELGLGDRFRALVGKELGKRRRELAALGGGAGARKDLSPEAGA
jgi:hypothetical protein